MTYYVFAVRDKKLQAYEPPVFKKEDKEHVIEATIRGLKLVKNPDDLARFKDFAFYYFGEYDDLQGSFKFLDFPEKLLDYEDYLIKEEA